MSFKTMLLATLIVAIAILTGCASTYLVEQPRVFSPCSGYEGNVRQVSFDAIVSVVSNKRGWSIDSIDKNSLVLTAKVSRRQAWIPMQISVNAKGEVELIRDPNRPKAISGRWANNLKRWLDMLEENYGRRRCIGG